MKNQYVRLHINIKESINVMCSSGDFSSGKVIIIANITSDLIKRSHNSNVSEITVSTEIEECISAAEFTLSDFARTFFASLGTIK